MPGDPAQPLTETGAARSAPWRVVAAAAIGMAVLAAAGIAEPWRLWASAPLGAVLLWLAVFDSQTRRLPDAGTIIVAIGGLMFAVLPQAGLVAPRDALLGAAAGLLGAGAFAAGFRLATGRVGLGGGDVKLIGALGTWIGWALLPQMLLWACLAGLAAAAIGRLSRRGARAERIAFGPWLAAGFWIVWSTANLGAGGL